jgi:hypothetical protein
MRHTRGQQSQRNPVQDENREIEYLNFINSLRSKATISMYEFSLRHYMQYIETDTAYQA